MKKHFSFSRKLLRVGKNVEHFKAAAVAADTKALDPVLKYCAVGRQLGYAVYLSLDTVSYVCAPRRIDGGGRGRVADACWMVARCGGHPAFGVGETATAGSVQGVVRGITVQHRGGRIHAVSTTAEIANRR